MKRHPNTLPISTLGDPEARQKLFDAILEGGGITQACDKLGINRKSLYLLAEKDTEFASFFKSARAALLDLHADECNDLIKEARQQVLDLPPESAKLGHAIIAGARLQVETHLRLAGRLSKVYRDQEPAAAVQVTNVGQALVTDEATRAALIDQRRKLLEEKGIDKDPITTIVEVGPTISGEIVDEKDGKDGSQNTLEPPQPVVQPMGPEPEWTGHASGNTTE